MQYVETGSKLGKLNAGTKETQPLSSVVSLKYAGSENVRVASHAAESVSRAFNEATQGLERYGRDRITRQACYQLRQELKFGREFEFFVSGTAANASIFWRFARPGHSILVPRGSHVARFEAGAPNKIAGVHLVQVETDTSGKITAEGLEDSLLPHFSLNPSQSPKFAGVFISVPSEVGAAYTASELHQLARVCRKHKLFFAADGARLPYCLSELRGALECFDAIVVSGTKISRSPGSVAIFKDHFPAGVRAEFDFRVRESGHATDCAWYLAAPFLKPLTEGITGALGRAQQLNAMLTKLGYKVLYHGTNLLFIALTEDEIKLTRSIMPNAYVWHTNVGTIAGRRLQTLRIAISPASTDEEIWAMRKLFCALRAK